MQSLRASVIAVARRAAALPARAAPIALVRPFSSQSGNSGRRRWRWFSGRKAAAAGSVLSMGGGLALALFGWGEDDKKAGAASGKEVIEDAVITFAPNVPPPINRNFPVTLRVNMTSEVVLKPINSKYKYNFWTFNGSVPGPFIRARVGDTIELKHTNLDPSGMAHNIDFHGFSGPGGGAPMTFVERGEERTSRFKLLNPGLYVYHCAAAPLPVHVANGMYGLLLVEPEEGLSKVDREYYVMQSEFYFDPPELGTSVIEEASYGQGMREQPEVVCFNGREGSLTNKEVLNARVGERVRLFFGNGGPNLTSSFHVIGAIFDKVYRDGDFLSPPGRNIQTTSVPPGGATSVEFVPAVPGTYTLVDHAIFRVDKGAVGFLSVQGDPNPAVYFGGTPRNCVGCKLHA